MICLSNTNKVQRNLKVAVCLGLAFISNRGRSCHPSSTMHFQTAVTSQNTFGLVSGHVIACLTRADWLIDVCLVAIHGCYGAQCSKVAASFAIHASNSLFSCYNMMLSYTPGSFRRSPSLPLPLPSWRPPAKIGAAGWSCQILSRPQAPPSDCA